MENNDLAQLQITGANPNHIEKRHRSQKPRKKSVGYSNRSKTHHKKNHLQVDKCVQEECSRPKFKAQYYQNPLILLYRLCRHHFCNKVRAALRKELRNIFRGPEKAYSSMDFTGRGFITEEDFLNSLVITRIPFTKEDVREYFNQQNLFCSSAQINDKKTGIQAPENSINFDKFKKTFFPHLYQQNEDNESEADKEAKKNKSQLKQNKEKQPEIITDRLKKLEKILKDKFSNNWESVRKAFLDLDTDYDGYITVEDILRYFGQEKDFSYNDLKKLITDKDSKKIGKIGYTDFSKWVGNSIHMSEGFYFRHDSIKNPQYEKNLEKQEKRFTDQQRKQQQDCLINENLEKTVLDKMQFQWKTLRKAFMDLNAEKSGFIEPEELRFYLKHWGLNLTDEQFMHIFHKFDLDKDGKISYKDFQMTIGSEIHPAEGLYFRQDKPQQNKINHCKHDKCWQPTSGSAVFCTLHQKMHQDQCMNLFGRIFKQLGANWRKLINDFKKKSSKDDQNQIFFEDFEKVLQKYNVSLKEVDKENLLDSFPGVDVGVKRRINISRIYDQKYTEMLGKMYKKIDMHENDGSDDPVDTAGYLGQFYREKKTLLPITESEFIATINSNNKLAQIIRMIKEIDKSHNGYVTSTELDDIIKLNYKEELGNKDLSQIIKKYSSIQNRILIDYKKFKDDIISQLKMINSNYTYKGSESPSPIKSPFNARNSILAQLHKRIQSGEQSPLKLTAPDGIVHVNQFLSSKASKKYHTQGRASQIGEINKGDVSDEQRYVKYDPKERKSTMNIRLDQTELNNLLHKVKTRKSTQNFIEERNGDYNNLNKSVGALNHQRMERNSIGFKPRNFIQSSSQLNDYTGSYNRAMNRTINEQSQKEILDLKFKDLMKSKLGYEWKNIFRILQNGDKDQKGFVTKQEFETCTHQCGAVLSREDMRKILELYGKGEKFINYFDITKDLGMQNQILYHQKTPKSRLGEAQRLRVMYNSSEVRRSTSKDHSQYGAFISGNENSKQEIKETLIKKIREFRDLVQLYQRRNHLNQAIIPISDFKSILKAIGLNVSAQTLSKFLVTQSLNPENQQMRRSLDRSQAKASTQYSNFYNSVSGVGGAGIDAKDFLKFYI